MKKPFYQFSRLLFAAGITALSCTTHAATTPPSKSVGDTFQLNASSSCNPPPTPIFSSATADICTVDNQGNVTALKVGTCTITVSYPANSTCKAATVSQSYAIVQANQAISFTPSTSGTVGDTITLSATGGKSGNAVTFASNTTAICTVSGNTLSLIAAGTCTVVANQAGNGNYNAAPSVTANITVSELVQQEQNITLQLTPATGIVGDKITVTTTGDASNNPVNLQVSTTDTCSLQGTTLTLLKEGTCTVNATQAGDTQYLEGSASTGLTVETDKAQFSATVSSNKDGSGQLTQVSQIDTVNIQLKVTAAPKDVGKTADLFLTVKMGDSQYILTEQGWDVWDAVTLKRAKQVTLTADAQAIPVFSRQLPIAGILEFQAGYRLAGNNELNQGFQTVLSLTVNAASAAELAKADCLSKNGVYYAQQCFTDVKSLGNGFSGGIYVEGQTGLQTNVNLACRLGKKIAVLGRFNTPATDIGKTAEVLLAFALQNGKIYQYNGSGFSEFVDIASLSGNAIGALPAIYSAVFFEGELPTTGSLQTYLGYRLINADGSKGDLKYASGLTLSAPIESCDNPSLKLNTLPLGTGKGEVMTKTNDDGSVRLIATVATDGSVFRGWIGDTKGCEGNETTVTIKPILVAFTCQPIFISKQVLGTFNCVNGFDTEQNMACCDLKDPTCPAIPSPCNPPALPSNVKWIVNFPNTDTADIGMINITNLSQQATIVRATLYDEKGGVVFADQPLNGGIALNPLTTLAFSTVDAEKLNKWTGRAILKLVADEGIDLKVQLVLNPKASNILTDMTHSSTKHRLYTINPPISTSNPPISTSDNSIRVTNLGNDRDIAARFFVDGKIGFATSDFIPTLAQHETRYFLAADLSKLNNNTDWKADQKTWIEIFPVKVEERCRGDLLLQLIKTNEVNVAPSVNFTPVE